MAMRYIRECDRCKSEIPDDRRYYVVRVVRPGGSDGFDGEEDTQDVCLDCSKKPIIKEFKL